MQEITAKRTVRSKTFDLGNGQTETQCHVKPIHYVNDSDELDDVVLTMEDKGTYWEMTKNTYTLRVAKDFAAPWLVQYKNQIKNWTLNRKANINIKYEPHSLRWVNKTDLSDMQVFRTQQAVTGVYDPETNIIRYTDAFGDGIHFEVTVKRSGFRKEIVIDAKNKLELPPTAQHKLVAFFKYDGFKGGAARLKVRDMADESEWNEDGYKEGDKGFRMVEDDGLESLIRPAYIYDSSDDAPQLPIKVFWRKHNGFLWQAKVLPKAYLQNATYPVRADTDTTSSPDADTETDTVDGGTEQGWNAGWSTTHDQTTSDGTTDNTNYLSWGGQNYAPGVRHNNSLGYDIYRSHMMFKYNIASGQNIDAVKLEVTNDNRAEYTDNDAQAYVNVYENTNSSGSKTSLSSSDANIANIDTANALATAIDLDTITTGTPGSEETFTFNATGEGKITADGTDKFLFLTLLEGHDAEDTALATGGNDNTLSFYSAESAYDPVLTITHTASNNVKSVAGVSNV